MDELGAVRRESQVEGFKAVQDENRRISEETAGDRLKRLEAGEWPLKPEAGNRLRQVSETPVKRRPR